MKRSDETWPRGRLFFRCPAFLVLLCNIQREAPKNHPCGIARRGRCAGPAGHCLHRAAAPAGSCPVLARHVAGALQQKQRFGASLPLRWCFSVSGILSFSVAEKCSERWRFGCLFFSAPWERCCVRGGVIAFVLLLLVLLPCYVSAEQPCDIQTNKQAVHFGFF